MTDSDVEDPLHQQMGVSEKIRLYLDQMQRCESSTSSPQTPTPRKHYTNRTNDRKVSSQILENANDAYHARHSKCFIPYVQSTESPRNPKSKNTKTNPTNPKLISSRQPCRSENCISSTKPKALAKSKGVVESTIASPKLKKNTRCKNMDELLQAGMKKVTKTGNATKVLKPKNLNKSYSPASGSFVSLLQT